MSQKEKGGAPYAASPFPVCPRMRSSPPAINAHPPSTDAPKIGLCRARLPPKTKRCLAHCPQLRRRVAGLPTLFRPAFTFQAT